MKETSRRLVFYRKKNYEYIRRCLSRGRDVERTYASRSTSSPGTRGSDDSVPIEAAVAGCVNWSTENAFRDVTYL
jgi:hypothetical protein